MKNQQHDQARDLYFNSNLSKTEIADRVNVNRRTVLLWAQQGSWDKLRMSARHIPAMVAEKCYYLLDQYTSHLLAESSVISTFSLQQAKAIHLLASTIKKLKNRSTVNESMEMFSFFMDGLKRRDPGLAANLVPHIESYMMSRASVTTNDFLMEEFKESTNPATHDKEMKERMQDQQDHDALMEEFAIFMQSRNSDPAQPAAEKTTQPADTKDNTPPADDAAPVPAGVTPPVTPVDRTNAQLAGDEPVSEEEKQRRANILATANNLIANFAQPSSAQHIGLPPTDTHYKKSA